MQLEKLAELLKRFTELKSGDTLAGMDYKEFKRWVRLSGLTIGEFADVLQVSAASVSRYSATGKVPGYMGLIAVLLAELVRVGVDVRPVVARAKMSKITKSQAD